MPESLSSAQHILLVCHDLRAFAMLPGPVLTLGLWVCLQTKRDPSKAAKAPTSAEFEDVMRDFIVKAKHIASEHKHVFSPDRGPIFSFDNAPIHQGADLQGLGIDKATRARLPPSSPDMHKCIEHVFGTITRAMTHSLSRDPSLTTAAQYKDEVVRLFNTIITPASVQKDVASLQATYSAIMKVGGNWPDKRFR